MWMPALFFLPLLSRHARRLFWDAEDEVEEPGGRRGHSWQLSGGCSWLESEVRLFMLDERRSTKEQQKAFL